MLLLDLIHSLCFADEMDQRFGKSRIEVIDDVLLLGLRKSVQEGILKGCFVVDNVVLT